MPASWTTMPAEILDEVLSYLQLTDIYRCLTLCKATLPGIEKAVYSNLTLTITASGVRLHEDQWKTSRHGRLISALQSRTDGQTLARLIPKIEIVIHEVTYAGGTCRLFQRRVPAPASPVARTWVQLAWLLRMCRPERLSVQYDFEEMDWSDTSLFDIDCSRLRYIRLSSFAHMPFLRRPRTETIAMEMIKAHESAFIRYQKPKYIFPALRTLYCPTSCIFWTGDMIRSVDIIAPRLENLAMHICDARCVPDKRGRPDELKDVSQAASALLSVNGSTLRHLYLHTLDTNTEGYILDLPTHAPSLASLTLSTFRVGWLSYLPPNLTNLHIANGIDNVKIFISGMKSARWPAVFKQLQVKGLKKEERSALRKACTEIGCKLK